MSAHLRNCRQCSSSLDTMHNLRSALGRMKHAPVPRKLTDRLYVMASHEHHRRAARATSAGRIRLWLQPLQLVFENMMRPMALPVAGGFFSALLLFSVLMPTLTFQHIIGDRELFINPEGEVVVLSSNGTYVGMLGNIPRIERMESPDPDDANVAFLLIDPNGKVADWSVTQGTLTPELQSIIMLSKFKPATFLGLPMSGLVKAVQRPLSRNMRT